MLETLTNARTYMVLALEILDTSNAPAEIGAHLDLAIQRLQAAIEQAHISGWQQVRSAAQRSL